MTLSAEKADVWILNGPSIDATNEKVPYTVRVKHTDVRVVSSGLEKTSSFRLAFEPHSLTAIEIGKGMK
jgi:hypothetical protein